MSARLIFAWYDLWIGAYWDRAHRRLYVLPLPCVGIVIDFAAAQQTAPRHAPLDVWRVLLRVAPKARLNDLSDALYEQGYVLDMRLQPNESAAARATPAGGTDA